jgi:hypothetical protein
LVFLIISADNKETGRACRDAGNLKTKIARLKAAATNSRKSQLNSDSGDSSKKLQNFFVAFEWGD